MIKIRSRDERGVTELDWLHSQHTFSFDTYVNPQYTNFRALRVINDDCVKGGGGFDEHPHRDMEIITYVYEGALEHKDSEGNGSVIRPGQIQRMSAGTGIRHSEFNASKTEPVSLLQIWIVPGQTGLKPSYEQVEFDREQMKGRWSLIASPQGGEAQVKIHQNVSIYASELHREDMLSYTVKARRHGWLQIVKGEILLNNTPFKAGDGAAVTEKAELNLIGMSESPAEILLFDLA